MKRLAAVLLSLCFICVFTSGALAARMVQPFSTTYYSIYIPGDWVIDTSSQADYYGALDLGFMYSADKRMLIEAKMNYYSDWAQDALWSSASNQWDNYVAFLMDDFKAEKPEFIARFEAGKYPGALIRGTNSYGAYLYGEVMINAYAFGFYFYLLNEDDTVNSGITADEVELFQSILETFNPTNVTTTAIPVS